MKKGILAMILTVVISIGCQKTGDQITLNDEASAAYYSVNYLESVQSSADLSYNIKITDPSILNWSVKCSAYSLPGCGASITIQLKAGETVIGASNIEKVTIIYGFTECEPGNDYYTKNISGNYNVVYTNNLTYSGGYINLNSATKTITGTLNFKYVYGLDYFYAYANYNLSYSGGYYSGTVKVNDRLMSWTEILGNKKSMRIKK